MTTPFTHPYEDCVVGGPSTLYVPARAKPFNTECLFRVPFAAADEEKNDAETDQLQTEMEHHVAKLRSNRSRRREGMRFYEALLRGVPHRWEAYYERWLRWYQSELGMFKHRDGIRLRRYQRGKKYCAVVQCNGRYFYGLYASKRELEQDVGPLK